MAFTPARIRGILVATGLAAALTLTACGGAADNATADEPATGLTVEDAWIVTAEEGMTAAFAVLGNNSDGDVVIESAECDLSRVELHEMTTSDGGDMVMREKQAGFTIAAGQTHTLEPGGDHLMLMDLTEPIVAGDEVEITLHLSDGDPVTFTAVAKDHAGADEEYEGDHDGHDEEHEDDHDGHGA